MVDQTIQFLDGIAKDIFMKIQDDYVPANFMILDMGMDEEIPLILGRPFLNTTNAIIYVGFGQIYFYFLGWKVKCAFNDCTTNKQVVTSIFKDKNRMHKSLMCALRNSHTHKLTNYKVSSQCLYIENEYLSHSLI
jgi:hypothetical protein